MPSATTTWGLPPSLPTLGQDQVHIWKADLDRARGLCGWTLGACLIAAFVSWKRSRCEDGGSLSSRDGPGWRPTRRLRASASHLILAILEVSLEPLERGPSGRV